MTREAKFRQTGAATVLENFLDNEVDRISRNLFDDLEEVAEEIDEMVNEILTELQNTHGDNEELKNEIKQLEARIEELEESK